MYINEEKLESHRYPKEIIDCFKDFIGKEMKRWAIVSLSSNTPDNLPMWAYYANNHQGYCVEYDVIHPDAIFQVSYEPRRIPLASILASFYAEIARIQKHGEETSAEAEFYASIIRQQLFMKHEHEYRIAYPCENSNGVVKSIKEIGLRTSRIIAGLVCSNHNIEMLMQIASSLHCPLLQTKICEDKYILLEGK